MLSLIDILAGAILVFGIAVVASRFAGLRSPSVVVLAHAALPLLLFPVWIAAGITAWRGHPIRFGIAAALCAIYVFSVQPAVHRRPIPVFAQSPVDRARTIKVFASNVFVDNESEFGSSLPVSGPDAADVLVFTEFSAPIEASLRRGGWLEEYPHRAENGDEGTNRTVIFSRYPFAAEPKVIPISDDRGLSCPLVVIDVVLPSGSTVRVIGAHPRPLTVKGADLAFVNTVRVLQDEVLRARSEAGAAGQLGGIPLLIVGDFNGTRWLPVTGQLFDNGIADTHEAMGFGLSTSWPRGLSVLPRFMRLDHAFFSGPIAPFALRDVDVQGSDHEGFLATFAVPAVG